MKISKFEIYKITMMFINELVMNGVITETVVKSDHFRGTTNTFFSIVSEFKHPIVNVRATHLTLVFRINC